jgi:hypothetical protein
MIAILLLFTWISQGIPATPSQTGTVTGTLKTDIGTPAAGVRVAAMARPETATEISSATALASIASTDDQGHFRLENVPAGRYFITAGRVDYPTYFPGTQDVSAGRVVLVKPGDVISGIDFVMNAIAVRPPEAFSLFVFGSGSPSFNIPVSVSVDGGGRLPVFSAAGFTSLRLQRITDGQVTVLPLSAASLALPLPTVGVSPDYRIAIDNLPQGYTVGSIKYAGAAITNGTLKLSTTSATLTATILTATSGSIQGPVILSATGAIPAGAMPGGSGLTITLVNTPAATSPSSGVRVTGNAPNSEIRSIYLSGTPGIFFADGSFEFRGVQPGRYSIATPDNPSSSRPLGAAIVVGNQDVQGIELSAVPLLPTNIRTPVSAEPVGTHTPGSTIPLALVHGLVLDESTHQPITEGTVYLTGHYGSSRALVPDGRFEFTRLLPGSYELEVQTFGHKNIQKTIVVGEDDLNLELSTLPL